MLFNSTQFAVFFIITTVAFFLLPHRFRWMLLLAASCYFYMAFVPVYILILLFTIGVDYVAAIHIERAEGRRRKFYLILSIVTNIGVLAFFKYFNFANANLAAFSALFNIDWMIPALGIVLPIGLSFHTFQSLSYTIDVYRGEQKAERHLGIFALFVMFYPQLVAGPIERARSVLPQFYVKHNFNLQRIGFGLMLMAWGLFKKVVIADRLAVGVNQVYNNPTSYTGIPLIVATLMFAIQIYCDFSGYTDIALGAAQVMGFRLMQNFRQPYLSPSVSDFWRRWHISLSSWFRDYLYIPLGGNRKGVWRGYMNLMIVFLVSGLWHGASWTFVVWGGLHGIYLIGAQILAPYGRRAAQVTRLDRAPWLHHALQVLLTFSLVCFAWIFFRANNLADAWYIATHLFVGISFKSGYNINIGGVYQLAIVIAAILAMEAVHLAQQGGSVREMVARQPRAIRWTLYYGLIIGILIFGRFVVSEFIYFQF